MVMLLARCMTFQRGLHAEAGDTEGGGKFDVVPKLIQTFVRMVR